MKASARETLGLVAEIRAEARAEVERQFRLRTDQILRDVEVRIAGSRVTTAVPLGNNDPADLADTSSPGNDTSAARSDHVHQGPLIEDTGVGVGNMGTLNFINASLVDQGDGVVDITFPGGGGSTFADNLFRVFGSADATKLLAFEVDGFTTGTTRTLTPPNASGTLALLETANVFTQNQQSPGLNLTGLTASRLLAADPSKNLVAVANLASWIAGTANQITVTDDTDGTITLSLPQDIHTGASPTFTGLTLSGLSTGSRLVGATIGKALEAITQLGSFVLGTSNQIAVADAVDGKVTLSTPQDIHTTATPTFTGLTLTNGRLVYVKSTGCGPPTSGTYAVGSVWFDLYGSRWLCTTGGTPGTWLQTGAGRGAAPPVAGDFNGGAILTGYRFYGDDTNTEWVRFTINGTDYWIATGRRTVLPFLLADPTVFTGSPGRVQASCTLGAWPLSGDLDFYIQAARVEVAGDAGTWDASNKWTLEITDATPTSLVTVDKTAAGYTSHDLTPAAASQVVTSGSRLRFVLTKTGSPGGVIFAVLLVEGRMVIP